MVLGVASFWLSRNFVACFSFVQWILPACGASTAISLLNLGQAQFERFLPQNGCP